VTDRSFPLLASIQPPLITLLKPVFWFQPERGRHGFCCSEVKGKGWVKGAKARRPLLFFLPQQLPRDGALTMQLLVLGGISHLHSLTIPSPVASVKVVVRIPDDYLSLEEAIV